MSIPKLEAANGLSNREVSDTAWLIGWMRKMERVF